MIWLDDLRNTATSSGRAPNHLQYLGCRCIGKQFAQGVDFVVDGYQAHHLDPAQLDECGQPAQVAHGVAEFGHYQFVASAEACHELFPLRPERLVGALFLDHLYTPVLSHPFFVRIERVIGISLEYVTHLCHISIHCLG